MNQVAASEPPSRGRGLRLALALALAALGTGCFTTEIYETNTPRSATEQLLVSGALERALADLEFPRIEGHTVAVEVSSLNEDDADFLRTAVESRARAHGARVVPVEEADLVLLARAGALGTDSRSTTFGFPSIPTPFGTTPRINLVEYLRQQGRAKLALATRDAEGWHRSASARVHGRTDVQIFIVLFLHIELDDVEEAPAASAEG